MNVLEIIKKNKQLKKNWKSSQISIHQIERGTNSNIVGGYVTADFSYRSKNYRFQHTLSENLIYEI